MALSIGRFTLLDFLDALNSSNNDLSGIIAYISQSVCVIVKYFEMIKS